MHWLMKAFSCGRISRVCGLRTCQLQNVEKHPADLGGVRIRIKLNQASRIREDKDKDTNNRHHVREVSIDVVESTSRGYFYRTSAVLSFDIPCHPVSCATLDVKAISE